MLFPFNQRESEMSRIKPLEYEEASPESKKLWDDQIARYGRMTNMKRTLARSAPALSAYMEWYTLKDTVTPFLGDRLTYLFSHAISTQSNCLICGTFFRRILIDAGENPDDLKLSEREQLVVDFGALISKNAWDISDPLFARLKKEFSDDQILAMTAFAGLMVATNIINNVLHVDLDEYLLPYAKKG